MTGKIKSTALILMIIMSVLALCSCMPGSKMPYNGEVEFHNIKVTIPIDYIRDSTQSTDELWVFEQGNYSKYIMLSCKGQGKDQTTVDDYAGFIRSQGGEAEDVTIGGIGAVKLTYIQDNKDTLETVFVLDGALYAVALRGGDDMEYQELIDSLQIIEKDQ